MTAAVLDSMPVRVAATAAQPHGRPADLYWSGRTSGLAHLRLPLDQAASVAAPAVTVEAARLAVTARPDWQAAAAHTGAGVGTKVFAGTPTLTVTVATDRLDDALGFLCTAADGLTREDLADAMAIAGPAEPARRLLRAQRLHVPEAGKRPGRRAGLDVDGTARTVGVVRLVSAPG